MGLPPLRSGDLRDRIKLIRSVEVDDGEGGHTATWQQVIELSAEVIGIDGREAVIAQALQGISYYRIRVRFRSGETRPRQADQLIFDGQTLNIRSVTDPLGRREQLLILADTGSAQ